LIIRNQNDVTLDALAAMERTADPRARQILVSLVKHLHGRSKNRRRPSLNS
jgi:catechol 1,2-dioxygenase